MLHLYLYISVRSNYKSSTMLAGFPGTGKTLLLGENFKIKDSQFQKEGLEDVEKIVTSFGHSEEKRNSQDALLKKYEELYLKNIKDVRYITMKKLCRTRELKKTKYEENSPVDTIQRLIDALSKLYTNVLFLCDEVKPIGDQSSSDWSNLKIPRNVVLLLGFQPDNFKSPSRFKLPPSSDNLLTEQLRVQYR